MGFKVLEVQATPNPNAQKFVLERDAFPTPVSFFNVDAAAGHVLATKLFEIRGVDSVLLLGDFVTINKSSSAKWADISRAVKKVLLAAD